MKLKLILKTILICLFLFLGFCLLSLHTQYHEEAHKQNCEQFGGEAHITYLYLGLSGYTTCTLHASQDVLLEIHELDIMNEIFGYNIRALIMVILSISFLFYLIILLKD